MKRFIKLITAVICGIGFLACGKNFLEIKQNQNDVVPNSLKDLQAILDDYNMMNGNSCHELGIIGGDEFYVTDQSWNSSRHPYQRNGYIWADEVYEEQSVSDWNYAYKRIFHANIVLDAIDKINPLPEEVVSWNNIKGAALFYRGFAFFQLAQQFCVQYDEQTASHDLGIPLRLDSDITIQSRRATVAETYQQIILDITAAVELLPTQPLIKERPSKPAADALMARVYLQIGDYNNALLRANSCLNVNDRLLDFNLLELDNESNAVFREYSDTNPEVLFISNVKTITLASRGTFNADSTLYRSYASSDLRKEAYFYDYNGTKMFRGSYYTNAIMFTGLAVDEVVLIKAECLIRMGQPSEALAELNRLLAYRHDETFVPLVSSDTTQILDWVVAERRKELVCRGVRWSDLRRLNKEARFSTTLWRTINGETYELQPNDIRYVWPLPDDAVIQGRLPQNER